MNIFIAIVFACVSMQCGFVVEDESVPHTSEAVCEVALAEMLADLKVRAPDAVVQGACIPLKMTGV